MQKCNLFLFYLKIRNSSKAYETKCFELQAEKNNLERQIISEEAKSKEVLQKINDIQVRLRLKTNKIKTYNGLRLLWIISIIFRMNWSCWETRGKSSSRIFSSSRANARYKKQDWRLFLLFKLFWLKYKVTFINCKEIKRQFG